MTGFAFHPEAETDLEEIWDYIAAKSASAAYRLIDIDKALKSWFCCRIGAFVTQTLARAHCVL